MQYHKPVLLRESIGYLNVKQNGKYIDCTLGDAGHAIEVIKKGGLVLGIDQDPQALARARERLHAEGIQESSLTTIHGNFRDINQIAFKTGFEKVDGILYDIGTSLLQLEDDQRGFSFASNEPLDMRMDPNLTVSAKDLISVLPEDQLAKIFFEYGGELKAKVIARAVVKARKDRPIVTGKELADIILTVSSRRPGQKIHPATKSFQALRIAVNNELENLRLSLPRAVDLLLPGGRLVIISFHSLEDKIAKSLRPTLKEVIEGPVTASEEEVTGNPRSRSAKMRVFEKI